MKKTGRVIVAIILLAIGYGVGLPMAEAIKALPTGGGITAECLDYGIETRNGKEVRSCLLASNKEFPVAGSQKIPCAAKYSIGFRLDGTVEYCTLSTDMALRRTMQETIECKAGGRVVFFSDGRVETARLKESTLLPYAKNSNVSCLADSPVTFRADGKLATCVLDQETLFVNGVKKKTSTSCRPGGLIAFDEYGAFNGCYPPPQTEAQKAGSTTQGGLEK